MTGTLISVVDDTLHVVIAAGIVALFALWSRDRRGPQ